MSWESYTRSAESLLNCSHIPSSLEIITLIKRVNPTKLSLSEPDRERGYELKGKLQNLLLENYGETFLLAPHPYSSDIVLIKHQALPSIDACHADIKSLSIKALDTVAVPAAKPQEEPNSKRARKDIPKAGRPRCCPPKEALRTAQRLLEEYDYTQAEELLAGIRISENRELPTLLRAARVLLEEMGAYDRAIETLLAQPDHIIREKSIRELLALSYYSNGMIPEARVIFDSTNPVELGKGALHAYADISFKDGNLSHAFNLLKVADEKTGFVTAFASLRKEIEACMLVEAEPWLQEAEAALARNELAQANSLAREALAHYPNFQMARDLVVFIDSAKAQAEIDGLWGKYGRCELGSEKLDLLASLLECDKGNKEKIKKLIALEKSNQKREVIDNRLGALRMLAAQENWPECFEILLWLSRQGDDPEPYRDAFQISPYFSVLYQNRKIQRISDEALKELWLSFIKVKSLLLSGLDQGCLEILESMKQYFRSYPVFREEYRKLLKIEQEKTRSAVHHLMEQLQAECSLAQARTIAACLRKPIAALPADEAALYSRVVEDLLYQLKPEKTDDELIEEYRVALQLGNAAKAALLGEQIPYRNVVLEIAAETAAMFAISAEPITVTVSEHLTVDLTTESQSLTRIGSSDRHVMYREDDETIVLVHLWRMSATRFRSVNFRELIPVDYNPAKDLFLFRDSENWNTVWRAKLTETASHFEAVFNITDHFSYEEGACFQALFLSCGKENDYYAFIENEPGARMVKQSLDITSNTVRTYRIKGEGKYIYRLSYQPDSFAIGTDCGTTILNNNLTLPKGCSTVGCTLVPSFFAIDPGKAQIYVIADDVVKVLNEKVRVVKQYPMSFGAAYFDTKSVHGMCPATETVLLSLHKGRGMFYNLDSNKFSNTFCLSRLIWSDIPSTWYYYEYDKDNSAITIKDITFEVGTILEWQVLCSQDQDEEINLANVKQFEDIDFFRLAAKNSVDVRPPVS